LRVISADCHINEPPWVFDRVPTEYRNRVPRLVRGADGGDGWSMRGETPARTFGVEAMAGRPTSEYQKSGLRFDQILPGNYDPVAHVKDMELDGVDVSIVYPAASIFTYLESDRGLALACMRAYNDWILEDFQAADPVHLVGLPMLPVDDGAELAVAELERAVAKGAKGAFIPGMPERPYNHPWYFPLWAAAESMGVPLTFHRTFGGRAQDGDWDGAWEGPVKPDFQAAGTIYRFFSSVRPLTYMIFSGIFERFPGLRLVAAEVNCGWLPFWGQTMDQQYDVGRHMHELPFQRRPSEYLGDNIFVTILDDTIGFKLMADGYPRLADASMFSTDYPHSVTLWPRSAEVIERLAAGLSAEDREKVFSGNAARVYGL
jgi:predicted TIM-barrel fold metal-dependent hydrolase